MTMREKAARAICRFDPVCATACEECTGDVDAVLDAIREPSDRAIAITADVLAQANDEFALALRAHQTMIDAIKRGEG